MTDSVKEYLGLVIDYSRDKLIPEKGLVMLTKKGFYKREWEESPQESLARASTCYSFGDYEFAQRIYDYASHGWFTNASPVLSTAVEVNWPTFTAEQFEEAGDWLEQNVEPDGLPISCFLGFIPDSKEGLVHARQETAWLSMMGGGISVFPSNRSPDEKSTGVMSHLKGYDADALSYKQSESRRGSIAAYMNIDHPEILSFLEMRNPTGGDINKKCFNLNNAVNIPDWFMEKMVNKESYELVDPKHGKTGTFVNALDVWNKILDMRWETGEPYIHWIDRTNGNLPSWITKPTYNVNQSNLCVAPETQVLTKEGYIPISELEDCDVEVWNGQEWSEVYPKKTGVNQKLLKVTTSAGQVLECTEYHKWYVFTGYGKPFKEKRTYELLEGDKLIKFDLPVIEGSEELLHAYDNGFFSGDGSHSQGVPIIYLYGEKLKLKENLTSVASWYDQEEHNRSVGRTRLLKEKFFVPNNNYSVASRLAWLAGYLDADGCIYRNGTNEAITACSINYSFLQEVQLMLQTLGVSCKISRLSEEGMKMLPANDGSGENREFFCQESYRLLITSYDSYKLLELGLKTNRLKIKLRRPQRDAKQFNKIVSVVDEGRFDDTWCFTEPKRKMGMFNGILTGNCSEITLMTSAKRTAVCCLSSLNLEKFDEWKDTTIVEDLVRYLDNVLEYFIRLAPSVMQRAIYSASKERAIGIGTLGYHSYLQSKMIPFESGGFNSAASENYKIFSLIKSRAIESSKQLATERGEAPDCYGSGMRNSHLLALAPNASSSDFVGVSPSIEPLSSNGFMSEGRAGAFIYKNKWLEKLFVEKGINTKDTWDKVILNDGKVDNITELSDHEKAVFKVWEDIDQRWIIEHAAQRQPLICQAQSVNIKLKEGTTRQYMSDLHFIAFIKGIKTLYYCRVPKAQKTYLNNVEQNQPLNHVKVESMDLTECLSCHG